jgi:hypothetical protein
MTDELSADVQPLTTRLLRSADGGKSNKIELR